MPKYSKAGKSVLFAAVLSSAAVLAGGAKPTQDFWDYMMEYSDEQGEILDPLEYEQIHSLKDEQDGAETNESQSEGSKSQFGSQFGSQFERQANKASMTKATSLKNTSSSSPSSNVSAKGAAL